MEAPPNVTISCSRIPSDLKQSYTTVFENLESPGGLKEKSNAEHSRAHCVMFMKSWGQNNSGVTIFLHIYLKITARDLDSIYKTNNKVS